VGSEELCQWKILVEPAAFRLVEQCVNQLCHRVPSDYLLYRLQYPASVPSARFTHILRISCLSLQSHRNYLPGFFFQVRYKKNGVKIKYSLMLEDVDYFCRKCNDVLLWCSGLHHVSSAVRQRKEISWMLGMTRMEASFFSCAHAFPSSPTALIQPVRSPYDTAFYLVVVANHTLVKRKTGRGCRSTQKEKRNSLKEMHKGPSHGSVAAV